MLVLLLGRPELVRTAGALTRLADAEVHALPPLRGADAARLLTAYLGGGRLPPADTDRLLATAQGNPFYLAELVTLLHGARRADHSAGGRQLAARPGSLAAGCCPATSPPCSPPASTRCPPTPGRCCATPRSSATPCRPARWRRCASAGRPDGRPAAVAAVELERAVDELLQRRMLRRVRGGYAFATPLMREAAYAGIGKADLAERHA